MDRGVWWATVPKVDLILEVEYTYILFYQPVCLPMSRHHTVLIIEALECASMSDRVSSLVAFVLFHSFLHASFTYEL